MYVIRGSIQQERAVRHYRFTIHLEQSLVELFKLYEELGGAAPHAAAALDRRIDRCLGETRLPRATVQGQMHALRRAKDLHRFLVSEPDLQPVKQRMLEHILFQRAPEARWAAIRELLIEHIDVICESPLPGIAANAERYKGQLSLRSSRLGRLLMTAALFNFDQSGEEPPPNLTVRFRPGHFPEHAWTPHAAGAAGMGGAVATGDGRDWSCLNWAPTSPLCRWEYLAADLGCALFRRAPARDRSRENDRPAANGPWAETLAPAGTPTLGLRFADEGDARQLVMQTVAAEGLAAELQRAIHRRHGSDGVRAFACVMARLDRSSRGEPMALPLGAIAQEAFGASRGARVRRARLNKVRAVLQRMAELECTRQEDAGGRVLLRRGRFLTVLHRDEESSGVEQAAGSGGEQASAEGAWTVLVDAAFYGAAGETLGAPYRDLPPELFGAGAARHPYRLALYVCLRQAWTREDRDLERSARRLFQDCGLWLKQAAPYRQIEWLKRELAGMKEAGWLGRWRIVTPARGTPLDEIYRLEAPGRPVHADAVPDRQPAARLASTDEAEGRALQEGWT